MQKKYLLSKEETNTLRGFLALGIVIHHLAQRTETISIIDFFEKLGAPIVSVFFFISGYGLLHSYKNKELYLERFFSRRLPFILIPFITSIIIFQIISYIDQRSFSLINILLPILKGNTDHLLPFSWYIFSTIYLYVIFYYIFKFTKLSIINKISSIFFLCVCYVFSLKFLSFGSWWYISIFAFSGGLIAKHFENEIIKIIDQKITRFLIVINIIALIKLLGGSHYISLTLYPIFIAILFSFINVKENVITKTMGNISYEIYLLQGISIVFLRGNIVNVQNDYLYIVLTLTLTLFFSSISHYSINTYLKDIFFNKSFHRTRCTRP